MPVRENATIRAIDDRLQNIHKSCTTKLSLKYIGYFVKNQNSMFLSKAKRFKTRSTRTHTIRLSFKSNFASKTFRTAGIKEVLYLHYFTYTLAVQCQQYLGWVWLEDGIKCKHFWRCYSHSSVFLWHVINGSRTIKCDLLFLLINFQERACLSRKTGTDPEQHLHLRGNWCKTKTLL